MRKQSGFAFEGTSPEVRAVLGEMDIDDLDTTVSPGLSTLIVMALTELSRPQKWHAWMRKEGGPPKTYVSSVGKADMVCVDEGVSVA